MAIYFFNFTDWYPIPDGRGCIDWDCDFNFLVIDTDDNRITALWNNCQNDADRLKANFPITINLGDLVRHSDKMNPRPDLKAEHPDIWDRLNIWTPFREVMTPHPFPLNSTPKRLPALL